MSQQLLECIRLAQASYVNSPSASTEDIIARARAYAEFSELLSTKASSEPETVDGTWPCDRSERAINALQSYGVIGPNINKHHAASILRRMSIV